MGEDFKEKFGREVVPALIHPIRDQRSISSCVIEIHCILCYSLFSYVTLQNEIILLKMLRKIKDHSDCTSFMLCYHSRDISSHTLSHSLVTQEIRYGKGYRWDELTEGRQVNRFRLPVENNNNNNKTKRRKTTARDELSCSSQESRPLSIDTVGTFRPVPYCR